MSSLHKKLFNTEASKHHNGERGCPGKSEEYYIFL